MSDATNMIYESIDRTYAHESAFNRRKLVGGAAAALGSMGLLGLAESDSASAAISKDSPNTPENIINIAATAEVLATVVNQVGTEKVKFSELSTFANVRSAALEERIHYETLVGPLGAKAATTTIYVPDSVFSSETDLLKTLVAGDQIFVNAYLLGVTAFGRMGGSKAGELARYSAEIMGVESVHRALALQALGTLGNDRTFAKAFPREEHPGLPFSGADGFYSINDAVTYLEKAGFGFGKPGSKSPSTAYTYDDVSKRVQDVRDVNTRKPN